MSAYACKYVGCACMHALYQELLLTFAYVHMQACGNMFIPTQPIRR